MSKLESICDRIIEARATDMVKDAIITFLNRSPNMAMYDYEIAALLDCYNLAHYVEQWKAAFYELYYSGKVDAEFDDNGGCLIRLVRDLKSV